jgi:glycosyltransferase involved in cell wall biosynthesis
MNAETAPDVSVIIPTYNHANFLREALQSVVTQSFQNWEAIVVNNYSDDDTISVIESFADPRIRLENFHNKGVIAASRNQGIKLSRGRYLAFLDSDDKWYPEKLKQCLPFLESGADLISHGLLRIGEASGNLYCGPQSKATYDSLLDKGNCITPSATVVRKNLVESVGCYSESATIVTSEDYHLWIKLARSGIKMQFTTEILGEYRIHTGNQSGAVIKHLDSVIAVVNEFMLKDFQGRVKSYWRYRKRIGLAYYGAGRVMQKAGQLKKAWSLFFGSIKCWPLHLRSYAAMMLNVLYVIINLRRYLTLRKSIIG